MGIRKGGRVKATVLDGKLIIEPIASVEDMIRSSPLSLTSAEKAEKLSEEAQKRKKPLASPGRPSPWRSGQTRN